MTEHLQEDIVDFLNAIEAACVNFKYRILKRHGITEETEKAAVSEENFALNYSEYTSQKLGTFEVAEQKGNLAEKWNRAYDILKQANATINNRYRGEGYIYSLWLWNQKIYRQKLKSREF